MRKANILFVCHGNICRSPAAEFVFKDILRKEGKENDFQICSRALSNEEQGNDIYPPMKRALLKANIPFEKHMAMRITQKDYDESDAIFYMDEENANLLSWRINDIRHICHPIFEFTPGIREIEDPWYSGEYDKALQDIIRCCYDIFRNIDRLWKNR